MTAAPRRSSLRQRYDEELAQHGFAVDPAQLRALDALDLLRMRLIRAERASQTVAGRLLRRLSVAAPAAPIRGVYLWGGVGRGKTWLMDLFYHSLPFERRQRSHFHRFMQQLHAELKRQRRRRDPLAPLATALAERARVLCLDELFVIDIADAMLLGRLLQYLGARGTTLVATSNVPPADLYRDGLQRQRFLPAIEWLQQHLEIVHVDGATDYRLRQLTKAGVYLDSAAPDTAARLQAMYADLTDNAADNGLRHIEILGRKIPVLRASDNVVWFDFAAVCAGPRSQHDYLEIAREYQTVLVTNVPILDASQDDAARRWIALVDVCYDHAVKLIVAAAAAPAQLYRGTRLAFEFQRTASLLIEMQSRDYLALPHRA
ncbi:MAG: cell division protein ZapE [Steroidobacteraceae bacterium]|nr:cell division protein ZapE [Steroidobacteraceae bacterium]MDW8257933.1 cell division protein ZapE [Gammaproteobacteria bacterium]